MRGAELSRSAGRRAWIACLPLAIACGGGQTVEQAVCSAPERRPEPAEACASTAEFAPYREALAGVLGRQLRWELPALPISAELDAEGRVESVCVPPDSAALPWTTRRRLARSLTAMRALPAGPACVASTRIQLVEVLAELAASQPAAQESLASCFGLRESVCQEQNAPVCGVFPDGSRRTFANACHACENSQLAGWSEGPCDLR